MQNKANLPTPANEPNLSSNKHLRTQTTPPTPKKQSQFQTPPSVWMQKDLPPWQVSNMIVNDYITTKTLELAQP